MSDIEMHPIEFGWGRRASDTKSGLAMRSTRPFIQSFNQTGRGQQVVTAVRQGDMSVLGSS